MSPPCICKLKRSRTSICSMRLCCGCTQNVCLIDQLTLVMQLPLIFDIHSHKHSNIQSDMDPGYDPILLKRLLIIQPRSLRRRYFGKP